MPNFIDCIFDTHDNRLDDFVQLCEFKREYYCVASVAIALNQHTLSDAKDSLIKVVNLVDVLLSRL